MTSKLMQQDVNFMQWLVTYTPVGLFAGFCHMCYAWLTGHANGNVDVSVVFIVGVLSFCVAVMLTPLIQMVHIELWGYVLDLSSGSVAGGLGAFAGSTGLEGYRLFKDFLAKKIK